MILWMEEILHHQKDGWNPINNGINHLSTGAGFLLSTVCTSYFSSLPTALSTFWGCSNHPKLSADARTIRPPPPFLATAWCLRRSRKSHRGRYQGLVKHGKCTLNGGWSINQCRDLMGLSCNQNQEWSRNGGIMATNGNHEYMEV